VSSIEVTHTWTDEQLCTTPSRIEYVPLEYDNLSIGNEEPIAVVRDVDVDDEGYTKDELVWGPYDKYVRQAIGLTKEENVFWRNDLFDFYRPLQVPIRGCGMFYLKQAHSNRREDLSK
jgi:hypothetical protein